MLKGQCIRGRGQLFRDRSMGNRYLGKDEFENPSETVWKHDEDQTLQD